MEKLIATSEKMTSLLIEYREALKYEKCIYHLVEQTDCKGYYFLIEISSQQMKRTGTHAEIERWLNTRKISSELVYNY